MDQWFTAVRDIGFPATVALILLWYGKDVISAIRNDMGHRMDSMTTRLESRLDSMSGDVRQVRDAMIALLEHFRDGPKPPPLRG